MAELFDKFINGISKSVNTVSEGSKLMVEKANLNTEKRKIDNNRNDYYKQLGILIYNLKMDGKIEIDEINGVCEYISECSQKITEIDNKLKLLETDKQNTPVCDGIICSTCGHVNRIGINFCPECGTKIQ